MISRRALILMSLVVCFIVSCTCTLFGPKLSQSTRVGRDLTVNYPEDWYDLHAYDVVFISPEYMDIDDIEGYLYSPVFIVLTLDEWYGSDWYTEYRHTDDLLDELEDEFDIRLYSTETLTYGDIEWTRASFRGSFLDYGNDWEGWAAVEITSREGTVVAVAAPEDEWDDYEDIFNAMLRRMEFND
jgi:hypothetical protein